MKINFFCLLPLTLTLFVSNLAAEDKPAAPQPQDSMSALIMEHLALREARRDELEVSVVDLDARIERRVTTLIDMLSKMKDSKESGVKVMTMKESAIEGLANNIQKLKTESANIERTIYQNPNGEISNDLKRIQKYFDEKIEKRLDQIIQLTASLSDKAPLNKPKSGPKEYRRDAIKQYKHNKQQQNRASKAEQEVIDGVLRSIDRLKTEVRTLQQKIADTSDEELKSALGKSVGHYEQLIETREEQAYKLITGEQSKTSASSRKEAVTAGKMISEVSDDLRNDFTQLQLSIQEYIKEVEAVSALKANLAQRK